MDSKPVTRASVHSVGVESQIVKPFGGKHRHFSISAGAFFADHKCGKYFFTLRSDCQTIDITAG